MKNLTILFLLLFTIYVNVFTQNLILNPGFESGTMPTNRGLITNADHWYAYQNTNGITLNSSSDFYSPDLFDNRADTNNCTLITFQTTSKNPKRYPIVGIPHNFLTLGLDAYNYQQLDSINTRNTGNTRFAALEANLPGFQQGIQNPVNRALVGDLDLQYLPLKKNKCYMISFWAASAFYWEGLEQSVGQSAYDNEHVIVSLLESSTGNEIDITDQTIITHGFCTRFPPCTPPYPTPYGKWDPYSAIIYLDSINYPDNYNQIVFKLNRTVNFYPDIPDVFIDDVGLYELNDSNHVSMVPSTRTYCIRDSAFVDTIPWFSVTGSSSDSLNYIWQFDSSGTWVNVPNNSVNFIANRLYTYNENNIHNGNNYFRCIITGMACGPVTSEVATLILDTVPYLAVLTDSVPPCSGTTLIAFVYTYTPVTYQWIKNESIIPGATSDTLNTKTSGEYTCIVTNFCGSSIVSLHVTQSPVLSERMDTIKVCAGNSITLNVTDTGGTKSLEYYWYENGHLISTTTKDQLTIQPTFTTYSGTYSCKVVDSLGCADVEQVEL